MSKKIKKIKKKSNEIKIIFNNNYFINIIDMLKDLLESCIIKFTKDTIEISTIDRSMVNIINIELKNIYKESNIKDDIILSVNLEQLNKILGCKKKDDVMEIIFKNDEEIQIKYITNETNFSTYKIKLLHFNQDDTVLKLDLEKNISFELKSKYFTSLCKNISKFDESIIISSENNEIIFESKKQEVVIHNKENDNVKNINIKENISIMVYIKYLLFFSKCEKLVDDVLININSESTPLEIIYKNDNCYIQFYTTSQE